MYIYIYSIYNSLIIYYRIYTHTIHTKLYYIYTRFMFYI